MARRILQRYCESVVKSDGPVEEYPELFPSELLDDEGPSLSKEVRHALVTNVLLRLNSKHRVKFRSVSEHQDVEPGLYFTYSDGGFWPIAELEDVKDVESESPGGVLRKQFRKIDGEIDDLEEQLNRLEYRAQPESDMY